MSQETFRISVITLLVGLIFGEVYLYKKMQENARKREEYLRVIRTFDTKIDEMNKELDENSKARQINMGMIKRLEKMLKICEDTKNTP